MFWTYLWRELVNRRKQTVIIAIGMALAIAMVIVVNSVAAGVGVAQAQVLRSVYGVGTDITISTPAAAGAQGSGIRGPRFDFGADAGSGADAGGSRTVHESRLLPARTTTTMSASTLASVKRVPSVAAAAGILSLTNTTFDGTLPNFAQRQNGSRSSGDATPPSGGAGGNGDSSFTTSSFSVLGLDPAGAAIGPLSDVAIADGRTLSKADAGKDVVILDRGYAKTASLAVGDTTAIGNTSFTVVGLVSPTGSGAETAANAYIPLEVAQSVSGETGKISSIYVQAASSTDIGSLKTELQKAVPGATVSTQADLAATVSGSLGTAAQLIGTLGTVLSLVVLAAAFLLAILFTIAGVTRRTREFGTLKAIGWSNRRVVGQVAGESVVQGLLGGIVGVAVGLIGALIINLASPTLSGVARAVGRVAASGATGGGAAGQAARRAAGGFGGGGGFGGARQAAATATDVVLTAPVAVWVIVAAVGLAVLGGLLAGAIGGWRASRLRPAEALRSVG